MKGNLVFYKKKTTLHTIRGKITVLRGRDNRYGFPEMGIEGRIGV